MNLEILRQAVAGHRAAISRLTEDRAATTRAPIDAGTAGALIDREIAAARSKPLAVFDYLPSGGFSGSTFNRRADDLFGVLATIAPDKLREAALASLPPGGISAAERAASLAKIDAALETAAIEEELALRQIDNAIGGHERRRLDARPEILVAPTGELQDVAQAAKPSGRRAA